MFEGFSDKTVDFMWGIRFNNEKSWFEAHKEEYLTYFYNPMRELGRQVFDGMTQRHGDLGLVLKVSRIYRDARRLHGRGPYKDHLWLCVEQPAEQWTAHPTFWFELTPDGWSYGLGYYMARPLTMAKLRARIGIMRSSHLIDEMIKAPSLGEAVSKLEGTRFGHIAEVYRSTGDLQQAELSMMEEEIASYREIAGYLPSHSARFLTVLLEKVEMDNLKNALRLWYSDVVRHHMISFRSAYVCRSLIVHPIDYDKIMNAESYQEMARAFAGTPYEEVVSRFSLDSLTENGLFPMEIALDHLWFSHLDEALRHLKGDDRKLAEKIYSVDVDLKNILMLTRTTGIVKCPYR